MSGMKAKEGKIKANKVTLFIESTKYFEPSEKYFVINYRVENLEALIMHRPKMA